MNLDDLPLELLVARGQYATIRGVHEDTKKQMQILCGSLAATSAQILRAVQPEGDAPHDEKAVHDLLAACRAAVAMIEACAAQLRDLAKQRAELRPVAWPKPGRAVKPNEREP